MVAPLEFGIIMSTQSARPYRIAPSLICADMLHLDQEVQRLSKAKVELIHFDVMDGVFVPRYGLHPEILTVVRTITDIPVDVHMMAVNPEKYIPIFAQAGADYFVVHAEACPHLHHSLGLIRAAGMKPGVALNPATPLSVLDWIVDNLSLVCLMAINPGIVGHKLIPAMMAKISDLHQMIGDRDIIIEIDGGVTPESAPEMIARGATALVCGTSSVFKPDTPVDQKIVEFRHLLDASLSTITPK